MPSLPTNMGFRRDAIFRVRRENSYFLGNTLVIHGLRPLDAG